MTSKSVHHWRLPRCRHLRSEFRNSSAVNDSVTVLIAHFDFALFLGQQRRQGAFRTMRQSVAPELCWPHAAKVCQLGARSTPRMVLMCKYLHFAVRGSSFLVFVCPSNARWVIVAIVCRVSYGLETDSGTWDALSHMVRWIWRHLPCYWTSLCIIYNLNLRNYRREQCFLRRKFCLAFF